MPSVSLQEWSFTRPYNRAPPERPPPSEDDSEIAYVESENRVEISGVVVGGGQEVLPAMVDFNRGYLEIEVAPRELNRHFVHDIIPNIPYEVDAQFADGVPHETTVRHLNEDGDVRFEVTKRPPGE